MMRLAAAILFMASLLQIGAIAGVTEDSILDLTQKISNPDLLAAAAGANKTRHSLYDTEYKLDKLGVRVRINYFDPSNPGDGGEAYIKILDLKKLLNHIGTDIGLVKLTVVFKRGKETEGTSKLFDISAEYEIYHSEKESGNISLVLMKDGNMMASKLSVVSTKYLRRRVIQPFELEINSTATKMVGRFQNAQHSSLDLNIASRKDNGKFSISVESANGTTFGELNLIKRYNYMRMILDLTVGFPLSAEVDIENKNPGEYELNFLMNIPNVLDQITASMKMKIGRSLDNMHLEISATNQDYGKNTMEINVENGDFELRSVLYLSGVPHSVEINKKLENITFVSEINHEEILRIIGARTPRKNNFRFIYELQIFMESNLESTVTIQSDGLKFNGTTEIQWKRPQKPNDMFFSRNVATVNQGSGSMFVNVEDVGTITNSRIGEDDKVFFRVSVNQTSNFRGPDPGSTGEAEVFLDISPVTGCSRDCIYTLSQHTDIGFGPSRTKWYFYIEQSEDFRSQHIEFSNKHTQHEHKKIPSPGIRQIEVVSDPTIGNYLSISSSITKTNHTLSIKAEEGMGTVNYNGKPLVHFQLANDMEGFSSLYNINLLENKLSLEDMGLEIEWSFGSWLKFYKVTVPVGDFVDVSRTMYVDTVGKSIALAEEVNLHEGSETLPLYEMKAGVGVETGLGINVSLAGQEIVTFSQKSDMIGGPTSARLIGIRPPVPIRPAKNPPVLSRPAKNPPVLIGPASGVQLQSTSFFIVLACIIRLCIYF